MALAVTASLLFGIFPSCVRAIYADGSNVSFTMVTTIWARALGLTIYCVANRLPLFATALHRRQALLGGAFQALSATGVMMALLFIPGPLVIMIIFSHTLMLLLFLAWKGEVKLDRLTLATTLIALCGLGLVLDVWKTQSAANVLGIVISLAAAVAIVIRMYVYGRETVARHPSVLGAENFLVAAFLSTFVLLWKPMSLPHGVGSYAWDILACMTMALGTFIMFFGVAYLGAFRWSLFAKLEPVFTALFSVLLIHEILAPHQYVGMGLVTLSLMAYQLFGQTKSHLKET